MTETAYGGRAVLLERRDRVATIVLNRPERHNALSLATWRGLAEAVRAADDDPHVGVIVLRGAGRRAFSSGADIAELETTRASDDGARAYSEVVRGTINALGATRKPLIAMIHGYCIGGGCEVAICADIRIADEEAQLGIPSARMGILLPREHIQKLVAIVGPANAKLMLFSGLRFPARRALEMGLVNEVVPVDVLEEHTYHLAETIGRAAPTSVRWAKESIDALLRDPAAAAVPVPTSTATAQASAAELREGVRAFLEKREPRFTPAEGDSEAGPEG